MAETTGVAELIVRVKDDATKQVKALAKVLQETLDPQQWEEVKQAMEDLGVEIGDVAEEFDKLNDASDEAGDQAKKTGRRMDDFKDTLDDVADASDAVGGSLGGVAGQASNLLGVLTRVNPLLAGIGTAIGAASLGVAAANNVGTYAKELTTLATISNTTTQELQEFAAAARTVGFDLNKSADVLKDLNDRFGDFLSTNGGALMDYFETLGANASFTAQELRELGTLEAIQAIQQDLEDNNVSLTQQIFLWESISGEASKLIPILRDGGKELRDLTIAARNRGEIFTDAEIEAALEFQKAMTEAGQAIDVLWKRIGIAVLPLLEGFVDMVEELSGAVQTLNNTLAKGERTWRDWGNVVVDVQRFLGNFSATQQIVDNVRESLEGATDSAADLSQAEINRLTRELEEAEQAANGTAGELKRARDIEADLKTVLEDNSLSLRRRQKYTEDLAQIQEHINELVELDKDANEEVLELKEKVLEAQKKITAEIEKGNEVAVSGTDDAEDEVETISLGLKLLLNQANAQLAALATDTAQTLQERLQAAAREVRLTYEETLLQMKNQGGDTNIIEGIISQETARNQFEILETEFDRVGARLTQQADKIGRQVQNGILSEEDGTSRLQELYKATQEELDNLIEQMQTLADNSGSQEMAASLAELTNETENLKQSLGTDGFVRPEWLDNMESLRDEITKVKRELTDFGSLNLDSLGDATQQAVDAAIKPLQELKEELAKTFSGEELVEQTNLVDELIDVRTAEARLDQLQALYENRVQQLQNTLASISIQQEQGLLSEYEAADRVRQAYADMRPEIAGVVEEMNKIGAQSGIPAVQAQVDQLNNSFAELDIKVSEASDSIIQDMGEAAASAAGSGFAEAITDIAQGVEDLGDVFDTVLKGILEAMLEVVQSAVAKQFAQILTNAALSSFGGGAGGAVAGGVTAGYATGGYVRGAGTTTSDSIMARLSDKEFVQPANATAYYGVQFMELLRRRAIPRELLMALLGGGNVNVRTPRRPNFSQGGFVSGNVLQGTDSGAKGDVNVTLVNVQDDKEAQAYLRSKGGGEDIVRIVNNNKAQIRRILGN